MEHEAGDDYLRRVAAYIRTNEAKLAAAGVVVRKRRPQKPSPETTQLSAVGWFGGVQTPPRPVVLSFDTHHLFYILMRVEATGIDVGPLDVKVPNPSRPMSFINIFATSDKSDTLSLASFRSTFSAVSTLSLSSSWWRRPAQASLDSELKYVYSSFTKLPALALSAPGRKVIKELASEPPNENATPLYAFKNLQVLECRDVDPRTLLGWDRLAESLRSLSISRSGVEDVSDVFIWAVADDQARREGKDARWRRGHAFKAARRRPSFYSARLPDTVLEDEGPSDRTPPTPTPGTSSKGQEAPAEPTDSDHQQASPSPPLPVLSTLKWAFLKHLSLSDNSLTFLPTEPLQYLTSVTHLDLSSNLLNAVPPGLSLLHNLVSLNLSDNMIESVLGIYTHLGQILTLNLSRNRLESICGLERLPALEHVDLRFNRIEDSAEVGRLATLPNIAEVWVEGNPLVEYEDSYRIACFNLFFKEGKIILLDGTPPGFYERQHLTAPPPSEPRTVPKAYSPPAVAVSRVIESPLAPPADTPPVPTAASSLVATKPRRKKNVRIVDLDGEHSGGSAPALRTASQAADEPPVAEPGETGALPRSSASLPKPTLDIRPATRSRHSRHRSEMLPSPSSPSSGAYVPSPLGGSSPSSPLTGSPRKASALSGRRAARVAASTYEGPGEGEGEGSPEEYRRRLEALRSDMGEAWLKVFSQSQLGASAG